MAINEASDMSLTDCMDLLAALEPEALPLWMQYVEQFQLDDQQMLDHARTLVSVALAAAPAGARKSS